MTDSLISISPSLPKATASNAPMLAFLNQYKESTRRTMTRNLSIIVNLVDPPEEKQQTPMQVQERLLGFDWQKVDVHFANRILRLCLDGDYSKSTRNSLLIAVKGIAKQRRILRQISAEDYKEISDVGKSIRGGNPVKAAKEISADDLLKMLNACEADENKLLGRRDFAILSVLFGSGLRAAEAIALKLSQIDFSAGSLTVRGKGDDERIVYPVEGVLEAVQGWLDVLPYWKFPGLSEYYLFVPFLPPSAGGAIIIGRADSHISYSALRDMVRKRAIQAGVPVPSPHWFRHSFATNTYRETRDMFAVQHQLGHKDERTTRNYIASIEEDEAKKRAAKSWKLPKNE